MIHEGTASVPSYGLTSSSSRVRFPEDSFSWDYMLSRSLCTEINKSIFLESYYPQDFVDEQLSQGSPFDKPWKRVDRQFDRGSRFGRIWNSLRYSLVLFICSLFHWALPLQSYSIYPRLISHKNSGTFNHGVRRSSHSSCQPPRAHTGYMFQSKMSGERMSILFQNLGSIPVEILFIEEPKYMAGKNHPDRWIPIAPSGEPLSKSDIMKLDSNGLSLRCNYDGLYYVYSLGCGHKRVSRFRITGLNQASTSDPGRRSDRDLWIDCKPPPDDEIDDNDFEDTYIIVERKSSGRLRGARVLLSRRDGDMEFLRYDCALRAEVGP